MNRLRLKPYIEAFHEASSRTEARKSLSRFMQEDKTVVRALKSAACFAAVLDLTFFCAGQTTWGWGFLIGSLVSLFSLGSLVVIVPILIRPHASPHVKGLLAMTLFLKLPFYGIALSLANPHHGVEPMGVGAGIALVPLVLTFRTAIALLLEGAREQRKAVAPKPLAVVIPKIVVPSLPEVEPQPVLRPQPRRQQSVHPVREGA
ncbi:MAG: hypothetical protein JWL77_5974 [Chthonomonadaceae bacterium]|nr:hypothetical protein [Chthonomonadaceae bacterium]